jgi:hypothetical protein
MLKLIKRFSITMIAILLLPAAAPQTATAQQPTEAKSAPVKIDLRAFKQIVLPTRAVHNGLGIAAHDLRNQLKEMCGAEIEVVTEDRAGDGPRIVVGDSELLRKLLPDADPQRMDYEEHVIAATAGGDLLLIGQDDLSSAFAVYTLLEGLGVRFRAPDCTVVPKKATAKLRLPQRTKPAIRWRQLTMILWVPWPIEGGAVVQFTDKLSASAVDLWKLRNRLNVGYLGRNILDGTHTVQGLLDPKAHPELMREHPEYYAQNEKGERVVNGEYEGCYTDPGFIKFLTAYALGRMEKTDAEVISLSQTDWWFHCKCARCKEVYQKYGNNQAGAVCLALNQVAEETSKRFPNRGVQAYAYQWTRKPPQGMPKLHPNVYIKLAPINRSIGHPLGEGGPAVNAEIGQDLRDWARLTENLCVWNYTANVQYFLLPLPNIPTLAKDIRFLADLKVKNLDEFDVHYAWYGTDLSLSGFLPLRAALYAAGMWRPEAVADEVAWCREFIRDYYGRAADKVAAYCDLLCARQPATNAFWGCFGEAPKGVYTADFLRDGERLLSRARDLADTDAVRNRVDLLRLSHACAQLHDPAVFPVTVKNLATFSDLYYRFRDPHLREYGPELNEDPFWLAVRFKGAIPPEAVISQPSGIAPMDETLTLDEATQAALPTVSNLQDMRSGGCTLPGPRQGLVLDFKKPVSVNFITVAAADGLQRCLVEYAAATGTFVKLQEVGGPEGCPELFRLEFPKTKVLQLRVTLDYTGAAGQCHFRRVIAGLDPAGGPTSSRMIDLSRTFHVAAVATLGMDRFKLDTPQEYFSRQAVDGVPYFVATKGVRYEDANAAACLVATIDIPEDGLYALEGLCFLTDGKLGEGWLAGLLTRTDQEKGGQKFYFQGTRAQAAWARANLRNVYSLQLTRGEYRIRLSPPAAGLAINRVRVIRLDPPMDRKPADSVSPQRP